MELPAQGAGNMQAFRDQFQFDPAHALCLGVERECFLTDKRGIIVPRAPEALKHLRRRPWQRVSPENGSARSVCTTECVGFELSASQLETRTPVHDIDETEDFLRLMDINLRSDLNELGLCALYKEVAPEDMPLDVFPDPTGRYARITKSMPREVLLAACRIIGTHVHVGMPSHDAALYVYNKVAAESGMLADVGDGSGGERLKIYRIVKPDYNPPKYGSWSDFYADAVTTGFVDDPRKNWRMIRLTKYGTIEFRMFGATDRIERICCWARLCHVLCCRALQQFEAAQGS